MLINSYICDNVFKIQSIHIGAVCILHVLDEVALYIWFGKVCSIPLKVQ